MVDLLPAGMISHGLYGGPQHVQSQPTGAKNNFGIMRPGSPPSFQYETAMVGAGFIACQGKRVCGATMTSDGFGRWAVPSAKDMADVLNMMTASNQSYAQYFDMTLDRVFDMITSLQQEVRSLKGGAGTAAAPGAGGWGGVGPMGPDFGGDVVQGRVVDGPAGQRGGQRAQSADRSAAIRRGPPGAAPDMTALENEVQELKRKFGMNQPMDPGAGGPMHDGRAAAVKTAPEVTKPMTPGAGGWDWRTGAKTPTPQHATEPPTPATPPAPWDRPGTRPAGGSAAVPGVSPKPETSSPQRPAPWNRQISPPAPAEPQQGTRPSPWNRQTSPAAPPGERAESPRPMQRTGPSSTGAPTSPVSPGSGKGGGTGGYQRPSKAVEDAVEVANLTAELDRCMMMRQVSAQSAGGQSLSNVPCALNGRAITPGRAPHAAPHPAPHAAPQPNVGASSRFKGVPQSVATKLFIK